MNVRARFYCETVTRDQYGERVKLRAIGKTDNPEDVSFSEATPSGDFEMYVSNKAVHGAFVPGKKYDILLTPVTEA